MPTSLKTWLPIGVAPQSSAEGYHSQTVLGQLDKHIEQDSERAMAPHSSTLAWKIPWRSPVGCSPWGDTELDTTERLHFHFSLSCIGEGNGNPLQCSCLENPRDGGAWAAVYGVAQSRTRLKRLSSSSMCVCLSVAQSYLTLATPWTVAHQAPLSKGFSRQEY